MRSRYWFNYRSHREFAGGGAAPVRDDPRVGDLYLLAGFRIERSFHGRRWLGQRFPKDRDVELRHRLGAVDHATVTDVGVRRSCGEKRVVCEMTVPKPWFEAQIDGLLGVRIVVAALEGLRAIGDRYELGPIPLRSAREDPAKDDEPNLFASGRSERSAAVSTVVEDHLRHVAPGEVLVVGRSDAPPAVTGWRERVIGALAADEITGVPTAREIGVSLWKTAALSSG